MILVKKGELKTESGKMKLIAGMEKQVVRPPLAVRKDWKNQASYLLMR